ncbi:Predicted hydrolase of the alpha/beta superfamily [Anaerobranca californiensis DSM 14826]|uniref:Predicted hydrolase of the alpha/beta superfamily n=1 Tax=Anaerobranca californiensis DSM 14826 TaxID=1120989 RepID=A0A1M6LFI0_9FIRM|nr:alpha/beta hydrolase-fold protein [Anaerobranca californiensis]SHJ69906.1 Predicted hydrolase of the alpha/beta superfamily [Anaerobranca californiensis DSM 14826]
MERLITEEIFIPQLNRKRRIRVYLPQDYYTSNIPYPVLYMHDGQNLFFAEESSFNMAWEVGKTLDELYSQGYNRGIIVVAIDNNQEDFKRFDEYSPWEVTSLNEFKNLVNKEKVGGEGIRYGEFIVETLKPMIDKKYRTLSQRKFTAIAGSSMGAIISLYIGVKYNDIFSKIGVFSPAIWAVKKELYSFLDEHNLENTMIYLDIGKNETSNKDKKDFEEIYVNDTIELYKYLQKKLGTEYLKFLLDENGYHNEISWGARFPEFIKWIFKKQEGKGYEI